MRRSLAIPRKSCSGDSLGTEDTGPPWGRIPEDVIHMDQSEWYFKEWCRIVTTESLVGKRSRG